MDDHLPTLPAWEAQIQQLQEMPAEEGALDVEAAAAGAQEPES